MEQQNQTQYDNQYNQYNYGGYQTPPPLHNPYIPYGFTPETYAEKKDIRKRACYVGIPAILMLVISFVWARIYYAVMASFGFTAQKAYNIISEPAVLQVVQVLVSILIFTLPFILTVKVAGMRVSGLVPLEKPVSGLSLPFFLFGIGFCAFANIAVSYAGSIFESFGINYSVDFGESPKGIFGFFLMLLSTVIVPGLVEEFACRGIIIGVLKKYGDGFAVLCSAVVFGLMHGNFSQIPFAFLVGIVLGYIRVKTGSLWICCLVHGCNNLISVLFDSILSGIPGQIQNIIYVLFLMTSLLVGVIGVLFLSKRGKEVYRFETVKTASLPHQKYKWFFTSPLIIAFASLCIVEALLYF